MKIRFFNENIEMPNINKKKINEWIISVVDSHGKNLNELNIIFCSNDFLLEINQKHLNNEYYTDIISFDYSENNTISGDIFISLCMVNENAEIYNTKDSELFRVIIHGVLHLLGYKDSNEQEKANMRSKEEEALKLLQLL